MLDHPMYKIRVSVSVLLCITAEVKYIFEDRKCFIEKQETKHFVLSRLLSFSLGCSSSLKPSLSSQWSPIQSFVRDFFCISFVCSQREMSQTKLTQTKSRTKLHTRLHWLERLSFSLSWVTKELVYSSLGNSTIHVTISPVMWLPCSQMMKKSKL